MAIVVFVKDYAAKAQRLSDLFVKQSQSSGIRLNKKTSNLFRHRKDSTNKLDVKDFNHLISIDTDNLIAEVEGMLSYEDFVEKTLGYGLLPNVVPQLKSITVGGAYIGGGIESSSFRYGLVHESIQEVDVLLSDGRIVTATATNEYKDLFFALPNSYGTFGYVLRLKIKLIRAKRFIKLQYLKFTQSQHLFKELSNIAQQSEEVAYLDGVIFSKNEMYLCLGEFSDTAPYTSNYRYLNIYYRSIQQRTEDYLTTADYIWRWDSDWFWCSKHFFMQNYWMRLLFGKWLLKSKVYWKIRHYAQAIPFQKPTESVIQDVQIPIAACENFLDFFQEGIKISPIWICPVVTNPTLVFPLCPMTPSALYVNFGFWDVLPSIKSEGHYNRLIEKKLLELHATKGLYSSSYYSEAEFWQIYDKNYYFSIKDKYDASGRFKDLFQKCVLNKINS